jgi:hypothetical protein
MNFLVKPLNIKFSMEELIEYFNNLEINYPNYKWESNVDNLSMTHNHQNHNLTGLFGYGMQSNLFDLKSPVPPYNVHKNSLHEYRDTELMFGFATKIKNKFPYLKQLVISAHPPGVKVSTHIDNTEYIKVHIPIFSNSRAYFSFDTEQFVLLPGKMYLINTTIPHGTENLGNTTRVHMLFKIPYTEWKNVFDMSGDL